MGMLLFESVVKNANSSGVVDVYCCWRLQILKFVKSEAEDFGFLSIEEEGTKFSFSSGCSNAFEDSTGDMDFAIEFGRVPING